MKATKLASISLAVASIALLASCKGRTLDNMTPNGDTVDVKIDTIAPQVRQPVEIHPDTTKNNEAPAVSGIQNN